MQGDRSLWQPSGPPSRKNCFTSSLCFFHSFKNSLQSHLWAGAGWISWTMLWPQLLYLLCCCDVGVVLLFMVYYVVLSSKLGIALSGQIVQKMWLINATEMKWGNGREGSPRLQSWTPFLDEITFQRQYKSYPHKTVHEKEALLLFILGIEEGKEIQYSKFYSTWSDWVNYGETAYLIEIHVRVSHCTYTHHTPSSFFLPIYTAFCWFIQNAALNNIDQ